MYSTPPRFIFTFVDEYEVAPLATVFFTKIEFPSASVTSASVTEYTDVACASVPVPVVPEPFLYKFILTVYS